MRKAADFRDMAIEELEMIFKELSKELYELVNERKRAKKLEKPHLLREKRREKARLLTIMHEKQLAQSDQS